MFPSVEHYAIGILNVGMLLGIFFTFVLVYRLLLDLRVTSWLAVGFAVGITLLAPQVFRLTGHYGLSYSLAIPLA